MSNLTKLNEQTQSSHKQQWLQLATMPTDLLNGRPATTTWTEETAIEAHGKLRRAAARNDKGPVTEGGAHEPQTLPAGIAVAGIGPTMESVKGAVAVTLTADPAGKKELVTMSVQMAEDGAEMMANRMRTVEGTVETL